MPRALPQNDDSPPQIKYFYFYFHFNFYFNSIFPLFQSIKCSVRTTATAAAAQTHILCRINGIIYVRYKLEKEETNDGRLLHV